MSTDDTPQFEQAGMSKRQYRPIESRFYGTCSDCGCFIEEGELVYLVDGIVSCATCYKEPGLLRKLIERKAPF